MTEGLRPHGPHLRCGHDGPWADIDTAVSKSGWELGLNAKHSEKADANASLYGCGKRFYLRTTEMIAPACYC